MQPHDHPTKNHLSPPEPFKAQEISLCINGLKNMNDENNPTIRELLLVFTRKISSSPTEGRIYEFTSQGIANMIFGLQKMSGNSNELYELIKIITHTNFHIGGLFYHIH